MLKLLYYVNPQPCEEIFGQGEIMDNELDMINMLLRSSSGHMPLHIMYSKLKSMNM